MNKISFLLLFSGFCVFAHAQNTFSKVVGFENSLDHGTILVNTPKGFLATCGSVDLSSNIYYLGTIALDKNGKEIRKNRLSFGEHKIVRYGRSLALRNGNVADFRTLQQYDTTKKDFTTWVALIMLNDLGDTLWTRQFLDSSLHVVARTLIEAPDSGLFLIGDETKSITNHDPLVIRVDKNGNEVSRHSNLTSGITALFSVVKHPNGKYYGSGYGGSGSYADAFVTEMDSSMKPVWSRYYTAKVGHAAILTILQDGNLVFGTDTLVEEWGSSKLKLMRKQIFKIDTNGLIIWRKIHDEIGESNYYNKVVERKNNELFVVGRRQPQEGIHHTLTKLTAEGDTIWMHQYAYESLDDVNYISDMLATEDGGVLMVGDVTPDGGYQDVWLLKVDSNGCVNNDCAKTLVYGQILSTSENASESKISIYPNPSSNGILKIRGLSSDLEYEFILSSLDGKILKIISQFGGQPFLLKNISSGVYLLIIKLENEIISQQKVVIYE
jgi:hypothetical protein|tara:strand:+ start:734 stop:2221 length:1488 start_codon:yes stop_codon:yes gene_type:complete